jgi:putative addiction module antidote
MMALKIRKLGNSMGVVIPKEVLSRLNVEMGDTIFLTESPDGFHLTAYDEEFEKQMKIARKIMKEDRDILRALAK